MMVSFVVDQDGKVGGAFGRNVYGRFVGLSDKQDDALAYEALRLTHEAHFKPARDESGQSVCVQFLWPVLFYEE